MATQAHSKIPSARALAAALAGAERICVDEGVKLTSKRKRLLSTLLQATGPLSAYELAQAYRDEHGEELPVMTVYRILDVFMAVGVVHKLRSTNQYMPCSHMACDHPHALSQFLICDSCGLVREMDFAEKELRQLDRKARSSGFHLFRDQLELHGLCDSCQSAAG